LFWVHVEFAGSCKKLLSIISHVGFRSCQIMSIRLYIYIYINFNLTHLIKQVKLLNPNLLICVGFVSSSRVASKITSPMYIYCISFLQTNHLICKTHMLSHFFANQRVHGMEGKKNSSCIYDVIFCKSNIEFVRPICEK